MKTKKDFDCVDMKNSIQRRLLQETKNMSEAEKKVYFMNNLSKNPLLSKFLVVSSKITR